MRCISLIATNTSIVFAEQIEKANLSWTMGNYFVCTGSRWNLSEGYGDESHPGFSCKDFKDRKGEKAQMGSTGWVNLSALWLILYSKKPSRKPDLEFR